MCSRVGIMAQGRLAAIGKLDQVVRPGEGLDAAFMRLTDGEAGKA